MRIVVRNALLGTAAAGLTAAAGYALAGPVRVAYPTSYNKTGVKYVVVERPDRKIVRNMYVNPEAHAKSKSGAAVPDGTVLVMEDMKIRLDEAGNPERDADGRFIPTGEVSAVFVMEKRKGWGETIPQAKRNGDWDYAWYQPDGTLRPNQSTDGCFSCHMNRKGDDRDYTFTYAKVIADERKK